MGFPELQVLCQGFPLCQVHHIKSLALRPSRLLTSMTTGSTSLPKALRIPFSGLFFLFTHHLLSFLKFSHQQNHLNSYLSSLHVPFTLLFFKKLVSPLRILLPLQFFQKMAAFSQISPIIGLEKKQLCSLCSLPVPDHPSFLFLKNTPNFNFSDCGLC